MKLRNLSNYLLYLFAAPLILQEKLMLTEQGNHNPIDHSLKHVESYEDLTELEDQELPEPHVPLFIFKTDKDKKNP